MAREAASVAYRNLAGHRPGAAQQEAPLRRWDIPRLPHDRRRDEEGVDQLVLPEETARDGEEDEVRDVIEQDVQPLLPVDPWLAPFLHTF